MLNSSPLPLPNSHLSRVKCYGSEGEGFLHRKASTLKRQVSWQPGLKEYPKVTLYNKPHTRFIEKDTREWLPLVE